MKRLSKFNRCCLSLLLCFAVLASLYMGVPVISDASVPTITVITGADYQPSSKTQPYSYCEGVIKGIKNAGINPYGVLMCGDYSGAFDATLSKNGIEDIKSIVKANFSTVKHYVFSQGNHDPASTVGLSASGANDTEYYGVYVVNDDDYGWYNGDPNNMSDGMGGHQTVIQAKAEAMKAYFAQKISEGYDKPIFVTSHIPLHDSFRTRAYKDGQYAMYVVDVLNEAGAAGLNIIYVFGHNHSGRSDDYIGGGSAFLTRGDTMFVSELGNVAATPVQVPLNFTYMNAGYVGYCANGNPGGNILNMAVFEITGNKVVVKRCSKDGLIPVRAQGGWWSSEENASVYGTTDAYLKPASGLTIDLKSNYNGWSMVNTYNKSSTVYSLVPSLTTGNTYVIANSKTAGSALAVKYKAGETETQQVTVNTGENGTTLSGVTSDIEWTWNAVSGVYGVFKGSGGRYLQIENQTNGFLRTSSDYTQTENGIRYSMWKMSSSETHGLYAYVYNTDYSNNDARSFLRSNGSSFVSRNNGDIASTSTKPVYIYQKTNPIITTTYWVKVEGVTNYGSETIYFTSWDSLENKIRSNLVVTVKDSKGTTKVTTDYTLGKAVLSENGYKIVPVYYKNEAVGGVVVYVNSDAAIAKIKTLTYNGTYYTNLHKDVNAAYGTDSDLLLKHYLKFGVKEGRKANPIFDMKYYAANNSHIKEKFGDDYLAIMDYYINVGYKEECYTAKASDLGDRFYATIGTAISAENVVSFSGTNVAMYKKADTEDQVWQFIKQTDGTYEIINKKNGLALTVENNGRDKMTNVIVAKNVHASGQRWFIYETTGGYYLRPFCSAECVLDIYAANVANGANVIIYSSNCTNAQQFIIEKCNIVDMENHVDLGTDFIGNFKVNGLDIALDATGTKVDVDALNTANKLQNYYFVRQEDGSYRLVNAKNKYVLGTDAVTAGKQVYVGVEYSAMENNRWFIYSADGKYIIKAAGSDDLVLSVQGNKLVAGSAVIIDKFSGAEGQLFEITNLGVVDYDVPEKTDTGVLTTEQVASIRDVLYTVDSKLSGQNIDAKIAEYALIAYNQGVTDIKGIMLCVNIGFIGGESDIARIVAKCDDACSINSIYSALLTDTGSQVGAYRSRNFNAYRLISKL